MRLNIDVATTFDQVRQLVAEHYSKQNPDVLVDLKELRVTPEFNMIIPQFGEMQMTDWAKRQLGSLLGVRWDVWFNPERVDYKQAQAEISYRADKFNVLKKVRSYRADDGKPGIIRAFLGPDYCPMDDEHVFDKLERSYRDRLNELKFLPTRSDDRSSHYTILSNPIDLGPIDVDTDDEPTRTIYGLAEREGKLPSTDVVYPGFRIRNSEVGFCAFTMAEFVCRLVCLNGCILSVKNSTVLYVRHTQTAVERLGHKVGAVLETMDDRMSLIGTRLKALKEHPVAEPKSVLEEELLKMGATKSFVEAAKSSYDKEPMPTAYGVVQAITRAARDIEDLNDRYSYENMAGRLVYKLAA